MHFHNDSGCAVANSLVAVGRGADHVQGCINGYGERTGNADLTAVIANLSLKLGIETIGADRLPLLTPVARHIAEIVNMAPNPHQPYVGLVGICAQSRDTYERDRPGPERLLACRPGGGW